jgi:hypothetical protein
VSERDVSNLFDPGGLQAELVVARIQNAETPMLHIAKATILGLQPAAAVKSFAGRWQE